MQITNSGKLAIALAFVLFVCVAACKESHFLLPGQLVLSRRGWDYVIYFNGLDSRQLRIRPAVGTGSVAAARVGSDGTTYAISFAPKSSEDQLGNSIVSIASNGATRIVFRQDGIGILDFSVLSRGLVILDANQSPCPEVKWTNLQGSLLKTLPAPCGAFSLDASTPDNVILTTDKGIFLQRGDKFVAADFGVAAAWINSDELMYWEGGTSQCTWRYSLSRNSRTKVLCGYWFGLAASPDGRYISVRVLTTDHIFHDVPELRVLDTQTGRYTPVIRGALPMVSWADGIGSSTE